MQLPGHLQRALYANKVVCTANTPHNNITTSHAVGRAWHGIVLTLQLKPPQMRRRGLQEDSDATAAHVAVCGGCGMAATPVSPTFQATAVAPSPRRPFHVLLNSATSSLRVLKLFASRWAPAGPSLFPG